jgi:hypothetical protein
MTKQKLIFVILLIGALGVGIYFNRSNFTRPAATLRSSNPTAPLLNPDETVRKAEEVFTLYLNAAKNHDIKKIKELSTKLTSTCLDATKTKECHALMDTAYYFGSDISFENLTNVWGDSNQLILSSPFSFASSSDVGTSTAAWIRKIIYFTLDKEGNPKVLYLSPAEGAATRRTATSSESEIASRLKTLSQDSDQDGLSDTTETCADSPDKTKCTKTDHTKRDSDGNGWWDSIDRLINSRS